MEQSTFRETCGLAHGETEVCVRVEHVRTVVVRSHAERGSDEAHSCSAHAPASRRGPAACEMGAAEAVTGHEEQQELGGRQVFDENVVSCWGPVRTEVTGDLTLGTVTVVRVPPVGTALCRGPWERLLPRPGGVSWEAPLEGLSAMHGPGLGLWSQEAIRHFRRP